MKWAILGYGIVGSGAYEALCKTNYKEGKILDVICKKEIESIYTNNIDDIINDSEIKVVAEAIGGIGDAYTFVKKALKAKKHVVSSNKLLISKYYEELKSLARENNVTIRFTSSAGGGIPWLLNLRRIKEIDDINKIMGIMNGTTNFILDNMITYEKEFASVLKEAQDLGYAEKDPSSDIDGLDTARKVVLSSNIAFSSIFKEEEVKTLSLRNIKKIDIDYIKNEMGKTIRYLGYGKLENEKVAMFVEPTIISKNSLEANVKSNNNIISLFGEFSGKLSFFGQGAGKEATGLSLALDIVDALNEVNFVEKKIDKKIEVAFNGILRDYYLRTKKELGFEKAIFKKKINDENIYIIEKISIEGIHKLAKELNDKEAFIAGIEE